MVLCLLRMFFAYSMSSFVQVNGFGWGFSLEGAYGYGIGVSVAWPLPGSHIPNQYVVQIGAAGGKAEMAAFLNQ